MTGRTGSISKKARKKHENDSRERADIAETPPTHLRETNMVRSAASLRNKKMIQQSEQNKTRGTWATAEVMNHCRNYLPHIENRRLQMITYRLYDSVPQEVIDKWREMVRSAASLRNNNSESQTSILQTNESQAGSTAYQQEQRKILLLLDKYEDAGYGQCFMKDERVAQIIYDNLQYHNGKKYELVAWCIMPNHVHVLIELKEDSSLSSILHSWRSYTANEINALLGRTGQVWMHEYFDRYIRDAEHFNKVVNYIHNNPAKAGLVDDPTQYKWSSIGVK